ncbi:hypothetical protein Tco_1215816 [Tanacetum coccineum]
MDIICGDLSIREREARIVSDICCGVSKQEVAFSVAKSMIRSLMCLTASRPDIMLVVYACAMVQDYSKMSHLHAVKRIFRYLESVERAITTDASLVAAQDNDNIIRTQTMAMPNVDIPLGIDTGGSPRRQKTMRGAPAQTRSERVLKQPNEPPLLEGHTSGSREGRMEHTFELMDTVPPIPHDSPLTGGYTPVSDEGRLKVKELMAIKKEEVKHLTPKKEDIQAVESFDDDLDEEEGGGGCNPIRGGTRRKIQRTRVSMWCGVFVLLASQWTRPTKPTVFDDEDVTMAMAQTLIKIG